MRELLERVNITGFNASSYITNNAHNTTALPNVAIAVSGGGYRAMLNGAGAVQAFDNREANSTTVGHLGGLLQASTYLAGLSGGGWLIGSIAVNNFTTVSDLLNSNISSTWQLQNSIFEGPSVGSFQLLDSVEYYDEVYEAVDGKDDAGFPVSVTDYWGRTLSYQLVNASDGGPDYTWSSIALDYNLTSGDFPLPILVADGRAPGQLLIPGNTTVYEFSPWEFGSWDPTIYGFVPLEFLGSNFSNGVLPSNEKCVRGYDNVGYVMGTSSSLFNQFLLQINNTDIPTAFKTALTHVLNDVSTSDDDIAVYSPNPFFGYNKANSLEAQSTNLTLVDGGEDDENIPLHPLIQPLRHVDVIFAVDSSADTTTYWPNGTSLVATYQRSLNGTGIGNGTSFPSVPDQNTFVNLGLNTRPTFFGCNSSNTTGPTPLIVYLPNYPYVYHSNISTFTPTYNTSTRDAVIQNGYDVATMANATTDSQWPACVGCAILSRSLERTGTPVPDVCTKCFQNYCWDGTLNSTTPATYEPVMTLAGANATKSAASAGIRGTSGVVIFATAAAAAVAIVVVVL